MAFGHGKGTIVLVDGLDLSAYFRAADYAVAVDAADTTTFSATWKSYIAGLASSTFTFEGLYDPTLATLKNKIPTTGSLIAVLPAGVSRASLGNILNTSYVESAPVGDVVAFTWGVMADGVARTGQVLKDLTAITADGNGSAIDGGAATTTGAIAHLHVTGVSAGDSVIVTIEDSATGSSGWATIGTFASKTGVGAERITISGTVKRYTRAVWNETDDGGPSFTFSVTLART